MISKTSHTSSQLKKPQIECQAREALEYTHQTGAKPTHLLYINLSLEDTRRGCKAPLRKAV